MDNIQKKEILQEPVKMNKQSLRLKKIYKKKNLIIILIFFVVYLIGLFYYNQRFLPNTHINTQKVSNLTLIETQNIFENIANQHQLKLTFINDHAEILNSQEYGVSYNSQNDIEKKLKAQNKWLWFVSFFSSKDIKIDNIIALDDDKFDKKLNSLKYLQGENQIEPSDAKVIYKDNQFSIQDEIIGSKINFDNFKLLIKNGFKEGTKDIDIQKHSGYVLPKIKSNDPSLEKLLKAASEYARASITYQTTTGDIVLDGNTIVTWLSIDENGDYYRNDAEFNKQVTLFVKNKLAPQINIVGKSKMFIGANNRKLSVPGGNYGYKLDIEKEVEGLLKDIYDNKKETRTPMTTGIQASYQNGGLGDTFVEIDMTKQHMWMHKNGSVVLESDIVTGMANDPNKRTPGGTYSIYFKQLNRTLIGEMQPNGKPEYETPVAYWMAFNRGIGLHDATWQPQFGGNLYYTRGSHGCINLPKAIARQLYSLVKVDTPVVCYY